MKEVFIVCYYNEFIKNTTISHVTDDIKNACSVANHEKQDNRNDTYWIEGWNRSGLFAKFEEDYFMDVDD